MARLNGLSAAQLLDELVAYPDEPLIRILFLSAILELPRIPGIQIGPESHGVMRALGVFRGESWCYSIAPAKSWLKVWLRPPEISARPDIAARFRNAFPLTDDPKSGALTTRLTDQESLSILLGLISE